MTFLQSFREQFGISQNDFAGILQCHTSQLTMAESGRRSLPQESKTILRHLEQAFEQYVPPRNNSNAIPASVTTFLQNKIKKCTAELAQLALEKETLEKKLTTAQQLEKLLLALKSNPLPIQAEEAALQIEILDRKLPIKLTKIYTELSTNQIKIGSVNGELSAALAVLNQL